MAQDCEIKEGYVANEKGGFDLKELFIMQVQILFRCKDCKNFFMVDHAFHLPSQKVKYCPYCGSKNIEVTSTLDIPIAVETIKEMAKKLGKKWE